MIKLKRFSICVLAMLALLCFVCGASIKNAKAEESPSPKVYASDISVRQGSYAYAYIKAENFVSVGSLELFVYYDSNVFSVNGQSVTGIIKNEMVSTNVATVGEAELFMASATGVNGSGNIWQITFKVNSDAPIGVYPITIAIGEANAMDFSPITIETQNFYIDVKEKAQSIKTTTFVSTTPSAIAQGESASVSYYVSGNSNNFASAEFEINYDSELLSLDNVGLGTVLTNLNGAITSVNDSVKGCVKISFAALSGVSSYIYSSNPLFTLTFRALKNVENEVAEIMMDASALYDINFNAIDGNSVVTSVSFIYDEPEIILPKIYLESYNGYDKNFVLNIVAEKETAIAAGDFIVTYDPTKLSCLSVDKQIDSSTIVSNVKKDENGIEVGQIKFSFICSGGISQQTALVSFSFLPLGVGTFDLNLSGSGIINGSYQSVAVDCVGGKAIVGHEIVTCVSQAPTCTEKGWKEYVTCKNCDYSTYEEISANGHDYNSVVTAPTCTDKGYTTYTCHCGDSYIDNYVNALGHTEGKIVVENNLLPDCTNEGCYDNVIYCTVCKEELSRETIIVDALGHTEVIDKAVAPTCTETGLTEGKHCNVCNTVLVAQQVVNALGHDYESVVTAPTCTEQGYTTYTCRCGNSYIDNYVNALGHTEVIDKAVTPTCTETGLTEGKHCSVCNTVLVAQQVVNSLGHDYGGWTSNGNNTHVKTCNNNSSHKIIEKCSGGMATCTEKAVCEICGEKYGELLEHEYSSDWKHDENYHYHECSCGDKSNISEHAWDEGIISREPTIEHEGERIYTCVDCGRTKTEQIPKKEKPATSGCASVTTGGSGGGAFGDGFTVALVSMGGAAILLMVRRKKQKYNKT